MNEPLISAYLDGALAVGELDVIVGHLETCPACLLQFHEIKAVRAALRTLPMAEPPEELIAAVDVGPWDHVAPDVIATHPGDALSAYLDGELATAESEALTAHVAGCGACRAELQELDAARTAIRALPRLDPPDMSLPLRREERKQASAFTARRIAAGLAGTAAAVVIVVAMFGSSSEPQAVDIDRLVVHHNARQSVEAGFSVIPAIASEPSR